MHAMEIYAVRRPFLHRNDDVDFSTMLLGALGFLALVLVCLLASKAIGWLRNRRKPDGETAGRRPEEAGHYGSDLGNFASGIAADDEAQNNERGP